MKSSGKVHMELSDIDLDFKKRHANMWLGIKNAVLGEL